MNLIFLTISLLNEIAGDISYGLEVFEQEKLRKKAEEELLKSKRSYQILTETSPVGIFHTDASGRPAVSISAR